MKKILSFNKVVAFLTALLFTVDSFAIEFWMPSTIFITPTGAISHTFPFPTSGQPGAAFGSTSVGVAGFFPVPLGKVTKFKRIYALEGKSAAPGELIESDGIFIPANNQAGYRVIEKQDIALGLNLTAVVSLASGWIGLGFAGGVTSVIGKGYLANRYAPSLDATNKLVKVQVPETLVMVKDNWKVGDTFTTTRVASLAFSAGVGMMGGALLAVGLGGEVNSSWNVGLAFLPPKRQGDAPQVKLVYAKEKGKKASVNIGNIAGGFSLDKVWGKSESFEYIFDLSTPGVTDLTVESALVKGPKKSHQFRSVNILQAYQEALKGNLILADLLAEMKVKGVTKLSETQKKSSGTSLGASTTLPWLFSASFNIGKTFTSSRTKFLGEDQFAEELIGVYSKQSGTEGIISNDMKRISTFAGNFQQVTPLNDLSGNVERRYSGSYKYYYVQNNVSPDKLEEELKKLRYKIGFMKELKGVPMPKDKIGTLEVDLDVTLSNVATDELIKLTNQFPEYVFTKEAEDYVDGFFENVTDAKEEICRSYKIRLLKECILTTKRQSSASMRRAYRALKKMGQLRTDQDFKGFVQAYSDFGQGFIENRFTMKTFLRMLRMEFTPGAPVDTKFGKDKMVMINGKLSKIPYEIVLNIRGTNIAPYKQILYTYK